MDAELERRLIDLLTRSRALGFLGPGPVEAHIAHARLLLPALGEIPAGARVAELGSGGGVPGLVLAGMLPDTSWCLIEANQRRAAFLGEAVEELGWSAQIEVRADRAERLGRDAGLRGAFALVVARAFGPPAATAECGAPLLVLGGALVVSEPPEPSADRWPTEGLAQLGLVREDVAGADGDGGPRAVRLRQVAPCPDRFPRRVGVPTKRPLF